MENWNASVVYQLGGERHREHATRGETAYQVAAILNAQSARTRLATALVALAARLDPAAPGHGAGTRPAPARA